MDTLRDLKFPRRKSKAKGEQTCIVDISIFSVPFFLRQHLQHRWRQAPGPRRKTMDGRKRTIGTIRTATGSTIVTTRTITIGMTTKTGPTVCTSEKGTKSTGPLSK